MNKLMCWLCILGAMLVFSVTAARINAQDVKHPDMEVIENDAGEQIVVVLGTNNPPDAKLYTIKEEEGAKGPILVVYYKPTGDMVQFFSKTTIRGKSEGPGVSLFANRVSPQIEKVIGQKSYERELKKRYLDLVAVDKSTIVGSERVNLEEIDKMIKKRRN